MRAIIFANGTFNSPVEARALLRDDDLIVALDGGTRHAWEAGVNPHLVVGDLDSLTEEELQRVREAGVEVVDFPARKDQTDLELALRQVVSRGVQEIVILAALGGRLDQTVANLLLLTLPELADRDVRVVQEDQVAFLIRDQARIHGRSGDTVSLIPLGGEVQGVTTEGLEYPLDNETLHFGLGRGVSNVLRESPGSVRVRQGLLLCIVTQSVDARENSGRRDGLIRRYP